MPGLIEKLPKIWRLLGLSVIINLLFAIIYSVRGELERQPHPETKKEFIFKPRPFDFPKQYFPQGSTQSSILLVKNEFVRKITNPPKFSLRKFIIALQFSLTVFFKVGYRDTTISGKVFRCIDYKCVVWIEWVLGYLLLLAYLITLYYFPLINKLISGIF